MERLVLIALIGSVTPIQMRSVRHEYALLIGGATVSKAKVSHVIFGVFLFEGVLVLGQQIANSAVAGGGLSEVMCIMISNGIILYALTQSGGARRE